MYKRTVLENGLRIVSSTMPHTRSASVGIYVGAGSRHENDEIAGVSHFLEHMLFKGTTRRPTAQQISEEIEGIGGIMNAATDKELTVYWAKVGDQHFARCLDVWPTRCSTRPTSRPRSRRSARSSSRSCLDRG
jgi:predicted Zn-dependent peptidase